ncbi:isoaspartyl peptidase/L-asparaginase family protein [Belnapia rosea]|uniref:isoaspartyl peptidase/L-asparaginase family protein n=1 Tax=Belnapia rosea TaxID=938405 RepID=UPI0008881D0F|nr:isoaspartyl peptidase/L-asparaginase [Belnapia rosea]SDB72774.1 beta-aspartyl-peptidase (threonine type) [Belnapia rosea]
MNATLLIHGGAGTIRREEMSEAREAEHRAALTEALAAGEAVLSSGGSALDAVEQAVRVLEDCPLFNAGRGATFTAAGSIEMDAAVMDGMARMAGAVAGVQRIRNPVRAARAVMERTPHVLLIGPAADDFAAAEGLELAAPEYFRTEHRWQQLQAALAARRIALDHDLPARMGTVGAVARDAAGRLAAATSTGGMTNKRAGRVGDSPLIGAGTWADGTVAVSCTGIGEAFIRCAAAHELSALMRHGGLPVQQATAEVAEVLVPASGGSGGLIAVDAEGRPGIAFGTSGMYRGLLRLGAPPEIAIYR